MGAKGETVGDDTEAVHRSRRTVEACVVEEGFCFNIVHADQFGSPTVSRNP